MVWAQFGGKIGPFDPNEQFFENSYMTVFSTSGASSSGQIYKKSWEHISKYRDTLLWTQMGVKMVHSAQMESLNTYIPTQIYTEPQTKQ